MGQTIQGNAGPVFQLKNSEDLFLKLKTDSKRLIRNWNVYDSFNFVVTSWHLFHDWPKSDPPTALSKQKRKPNNIPDEMNLVLNVVRDITNGSKHFRLKAKAADKRCVESVHDGHEVGYFSYFFHEKLPGVTVNTHWYFSIRVLHNLIINYFEWVFTDHIPVKAFPKDLLNAILYCNIADREWKPPAIWRQNQSIPEDISMI